MQNEIERIFATTAHNGGDYWSRKDGNIHAPAGYSTIDVLGTLGSLEAKAEDYPLIREAIEFVLSYRQPDGAFRYAPNSSKLPCITASVLAAFGRLGYRESSLEACYANLLESQSADGGWRCSTVKLGKSPETDASNPGTTLYVLDAFRYRENSAPERKALDRGVAFLLNHWDSRIPLGPCAFGMGSIFMKTEFPMLRYNLLYYCHVLSKYAAARGDRRYLAAVKLLREKKRDGLLLNENPHKAWREFSFARKDEACVPATALVAELLG
jgi:hypothetical protein